jgi:hypothetical protein
LSLRTTHELITISRESPARAGIGSGIR